MSNEKEKEVEEVKPPEELKEEERKKEVKELTPKEKIEELRERIKKIFGIDPKMSAEKTREVLNKMLEIIDSMIDSMLEKGKEETDALKGKATKAIEVIEKVGEEPMGVEDKGKVREVVVEGEKVEEELKTKVEEEKAVLKFPYYQDRDIEIKPENFAKQYGLAIRDARSILGGLIVKEGFEHLTEEELIKEISARLRFIGKYKEKPDDPIYQYLQKIARRRTPGVGDDQILMAFEYLLWKKQKEMMEFKEAELARKKRREIAAAVTREGDLLKEIGPLVNIFEYRKGPITGAEMPFIKKEVAQDLIAYGLVSSAVLEEKDYQRWQEMKKEAADLRKQGKEKEADEKNRQMIIEQYSFNEKLSRVLEKLSNPERITDPEERKIYDRYNERVWKAKDLNELLSYYKGNKEHLLRRLNEIGGLDLRNIDLYTFKFLGLLKRREWLRPQVPEIKIKEKIFVQAPFEEEKIEVVPPKKIEEVKPEEEEEPEEEGEVEEEKKEEKLPVAAAGKETIRERINAGKIINEIKERAEKEGWSEEKLKEELDKALAQAKFAELENIKKDEKFKVVLEKVVENLGKALSEKDKDTIIKEIIDTTGLERERIEVAFLNLEKQFTQLAEQEVMADKKKKGILSKFATIAKTVGYMGGSFGAAIVAGPLGILGVGAFRYVEATFIQKARAKQIEKKKAELGEKILKGDKIKELLFGNLAGEIVTAKQEQIDKRDKEILKLEENLKKAENAYIEYCKGKKGKIDREKVSEYQKYLEEREKVKTVYGETIRYYLMEKWPGISKEDLDKRVNDALALFEIDEDNHLYGREVEVKNPGLWTKIVNGVEKVLGCKWLKGGEDLKERALTGAIFGVLGWLARGGKVFGQTIRHVPGLDRIFMAYGGMKLAEVGADFLILRRQRYEILKNVFAEHLKSKEEIPDELIERVRVQLFTDKQFKEKYPTEYAELWQTIDQIEQGKIKKAEKLESLVKERNDALENTHIKKKKIDREAKTIRNAARIGGALIGAFAPEIAKGIKELIGGKKPPKVVEAEVTPEEKPPVGELGVEKVVPPETEVSKTFITAGGKDNIWTTTERYLEQTGKLEGLNRAQRDYVIDFYCDRIYDKFKAGDTEWIKVFGLDPGRGYDFMKEGMKLNYSLLEKPELLEKAITGARGLSPEQLANILKNREIIGGIYSKIEQGIASDQDLVTLKNLTGFDRIGTEAREMLTSRIEEVTRSSTSLAKEINEISVKTQEVVNEATKLSSSIDTIQTELNKAIARESGLLGFFRKLFTGTKVPGLREEFLREYSKYNSTLDDLKGIIENISGKFESLDVFLKRLEILNPKEAASLRETLKETPDFKKVLEELLKKRGYLL